MERDSLAYWQEVLKNRQQNFAQIDWNRLNGSDEKLGEWSLALAENGNIKCIEYRGIGVGLLSVDRLVALSNALKRNENVHTLILTDKAITSAGVPIIVDMLRVNRSIQRIELGRNDLNSEDAIILASTLKETSTLTYIDLTECKIGDAGLAAICWALGTNSTLKHVDVSWNTYCTEYVAVQLAKAAGESQDPRLVYTPVPGATQSWRKYLRGLMTNDAMNHQTLSALLSTILTDRDSAINHTYGAVIAAKLGFADAALRCLEQLPGQAKEILRERADGVGFSRRHGVLSSPTAQTAGNALNPAVVAVLHQAACVLQERSYMCVAHLHICGEESLALLEALSVSLPCRRQPPVKGRPLSDAAGLAVVSKTLGWVGMDGPQQRLFVHAHRTGEEHRAVQAAYLATPHSVYVLTVSLWDAVKKCEVDLAVAVERYRTCLRQVYSAVKSKEVPTHIITVICRCCEGGDRTYSPQDVLGELEVVQDQWVQHAADKFLFMTCTPVLRAEDVHGVYKHLVPLVRTALRFTAVQLPVTPAFLCAQADLRCKPFHWPLICSRSELHKLLEDLIRGKLWPSVFGPQDLYTTQCISTAARLTLQLLQKHWEVIVLHPASGDDPLCVTQPPALAALFDHRKLSTAAQARKPGCVVQVPSQGLWAVVKRSLKERCIAVAEGCEERAVQLLLQLNLVVPCADGSFLPTYQASRINVHRGESLLHYGYRRTKVAKFTLKDDRFEILPTPLLPSLYLRIFALRPKARSLKVFQDGMELRCEETPPVQVVVRRSEDCASFVIVVVTVDGFTEQKMKEIGQHVRECCSVLHSVELQESELDVMQLGEEWDNHHNRAQLYQREMDPLQRKDSENHLSTLSTITSSSIHSVSFAFGDGAIESGRTTALAVRPPSRTACSPERKRIDPGAKLADGRHAEVTRGSVDIGSPTRWPAAVKRTPSFHKQHVDRLVAIMQRVRGHPNMLQFYYMEEWDGYVWNALELCDMTLEQYTLGQGSQKLGAEADNVTSPLTVELLKQITKAVEFLHSIDIIHDDLHPRKVMLALLGGEGHDLEQYKAKLVFSTRSRMRSDDAPALGDTPRWPTPEDVARHHRQLFSCVVDHEASGNGDGDEGLGDGMAADIYRLGCLFYHTLSYGRYPFGRGPDVIANLSAGRADLSAIAHNVAAQDLISTMLSLDPRQRPTATATLAHPFFWSAHERIEFLSRFSQHLNHRNLGKEGDVRRSMVEAPYICSANDPWTAKIDGRLLTEGKEERGVRYDGSQVVSLLRCLRNTTSHHNELSPELKQIVGNTPEDVLLYFERKFPALFMHCIHIFNRIAAYYFGTHPAEPVRVEMTASVRDHHEPWMASDLMFNREFINGQCRDNGGKGAVFSEIGEAPAWAQAFAVESGRNVQQLEVDGNVSVDVDDVGELQLHEIYPTSGAGRMETIMDDRRAAAVSAGVRNATRNEPAAAAVADCVQNEPAAEAQPETVQPTGTPAGPARALSKKEIDAMTPCKVEAKLGVCSRRKCRYLHKNAAVPDDFS